MKMKKFLLALSAAAVIAGSLALGDGAFADKVTTVAAKDSGFAMNKGTKGTKGTKGRKRTKKGKKRRGKKKNGVRVSTREGKKDGVLKKSEKSSENKKLEVKENKDKVLDEKDKLNTKVYAEDDLKSTSVESKEGEGSVETVVKTSKPVEVKTTAEVKKTEGDVTTDIEDLSTDDEGEKSGKPTEKSNSIKSRAKLFEAGNKIEKKSYKDDNLFTPGNVAEKKAIFEAGNKIEKKSYKDDKLFKDGNVAEKKAILEAGNKIEKKSYKDDSLFDKEDVKSKIDLFGAGNDADKKSDEKAYEGKSESIKSKVELFEASNDADKKSDENSDEVKSGSTKEEVSVNVEISEKDSTDESTSVDPREAAIEKEGYSSRDLLRYYDNIDKNAPADQIISNYLIETAEDLWGYDLDEDDAYVVFMVKKMKSMLNKGLSAYYSKDIPGVLNELMRRYGTGIYNGTKSYSDRDKIGINVMIYLDRIIEEEDLYQAIVDVLNSEFAAKNPEVVAPLKDMLVKIEELIDRVRDIQLSGKNKKESASLADKEFKKSDSIMEKAKAVEKFSDPSFDAGEKADESNVDDSDSALIDYVEGGENDTLVRTVKRVDKHYAPVERIEKVPRKFSADDAKKGMESLQDYWDKNDGDYSGYGKNTLEYVTLVFNQNGVNEKNIANIRRGYDPVIVQFLVDALVNSVGGLLTPDQFVDKSYKSKCSFMEQIIKYKNLFIDDRTRRFKFPNLKDRRLYDYEWGIADQVLPAISEIERYFAPGSSYDEIADIFSAVENSRGTYGDEFMRDYENDWNSQGYTDDRVVKDDKGAVVKEAKDVEEKLDENQLLAWNLLQVLEENGKRYGHVAGFYALTDRENANGGIIAVDENNTNVHFSIRQSDGRIMYFDPETGEYRPVEDVDGDGIGWIKSSANGEWVSVDLIPVIMQTSSYGRAMTGGSPYVKKSVIDFLSGPDIPGTKKLDKLKLMKSSAKQQNQ